MAQPERITIAADGAVLNLYEWGREHGGGQPDILCVHATGFHARCWDQTIARLQRRHVFVLDLRAHGLSDSDLPCTWDRLVEDLKLVVKKLKLRGAVGIGHSMGGYLIAVTAALIPGTFQRLLLIDPTIMHPDFYAGKKNRHQGLNIDEHPISRRRNHWRSWQEMYQRFKGRKPFNRWQAKVLEDYCRFGLRPIPGSRGFSLACDPRVEVGIYLDSASRDPYEELKSVSIPVTVLRAPPADPNAGTLDFSSSPTWPELAQYFPRGEDVFLPAHSHFIPMEDPGLVATHACEDERLPAAALP